MIAVTARWRHAIGIVLLGLASTVQARGPVSDACVVLLHGMGRTSWSMRSVARTLTRVGWRVVNQGYPSTSLPVERISAEFVPRAIAQCGRSPTRIHFVTHSLGGIIVRHYLQTHTLPPGSRIVMLAPPNHGSEVADAFRDAGWYRWLTGPAGQQLTTARNSLPNTLRPVPYDVGVIAGRRSIDPWFSPRLPGEDDGKVSVASTRLAEMRDFVAVDATHTFLMHSEEVMRYVVAFLRAGQFR